MNMDNRLNQLLKFLEQEPNDSFLLYALATEYLRIDKLEMALFYYENLIKNHKDYLGTYYHLGKLYETVGRKEDAIQTYLTGMQVAKKINNMHTFSELQGAHLAVAGLNYEDD